MNQFIQTLESRQMFSAAPVAPHFSAAALSAAPHATMNLNQPLYFQGAALNANGSLNADLLITVKPSGSGYAATVLIIDPSGKITTANLMVNSAGQFTYANSQNGDTTTVKGKLSADKQSITATGDSVTASGTSTMTITASRTSTAPTVSNYTGFMAAGHQKAALNATLVQTAAGYFGVFNMPAASAGGNNDGLFFTVNSTGSFTATSNQRGQTFTVTGQLSGNGKTLTGTFTGLVVDGATLDGTISLNRT